jgi:hypothetical protein
MSSPRENLAALACLLLTASLAGAQGTSGPMVSDSRVGYIDGAIPGDVFRFRFDANYNNRRPSRGEFVWPKAGMPFTPGPPFREKHLDYQDFSPYLEVAATERASAFVEMPIRMVNPVVNENTGGLGDMNAGFKYAFCYTEDLVASFQLRAYFPTGDNDRGLGNNHVSLEPALLVYAPLTERLNLESEFRIWVPVSGTDFAGDLVRYGAGLSYDLYETCNLRVAPVVEFVGWTFLGGKAAFVGPTGLGAVESARGDTIVNAKLGLRTSVGGLGDVYAGYGRALTGDRFYENTFRVELRLTY